MKNAKISLTPHRSNHTTTATQLCCRWMFIFIFHFHTQNRSLSIDYYPWNYFHDFISGININRCFSKLSFIFRKRYIPPRRISNWKRLAQIKQAIHKFDIQCTVSHYYCTNDNKKNCTFNFRLAHDVWLYYRYS